MFDINENLANAAKRSLRLPLPDKQLVIMCDASEHAAGYVLLIEDYTETNDGPTKSDAPVAFGSQRFTEGQMSLTMYAKEFLAMHFAFDEFAYILWGVQKPTIVMTDNKALTRFFQSKRIPPEAVELLRPGPPIRLRPGPCTWCRKPCSRLPVQNRHPPEGQNPPQTI